MNLLRISTVSTGLLVATLFGCSQEKKAETPPPAPAPAPAAAPQPEPPLTAEDSVLVTATATVQAINYTTREVTLRNALGNSTTFTVDKRVQRLNEVKVGDQVTADYYVSIAGELREPTAEEARNPLVMVAGEARAPQGTEPAAGVLRSYKVVTTVEGLDLSSRTLTLRGPGGNDATIRAKNVDKLKKLRLGDTIVVTYTEALAISVEKVAPKSH